MKSPQSAKTPPAKLTRDHSLDFLRGTVVFFMIIAHVNGVFYRQSGTVLDTFTWWGATVCFTAFLFVSGAVTGIGVKLDKINTPKIIRRSLSLLVTYYATAVLLIVIDPSEGIRIKTIFDVMTFQNIPEFTEFIIPFIFYPLIVLTLKSIMKKSFAKPLVLVAGSLFVLAISNFLYLLDWGGELMTSLKALLVGHEEVHRFGILSYTPIYAAGLAWGLSTFNKPQLAQKLSKNLGLASAAALILLSISGLSEWNRFPPSLVFFAYGFLHIFFVIFVYNFIKRFKLLDRFMIYLGKNALAFYFYHIIIITILARIIDYKMFLGPASVFLFVLILLATVFVIYIGQNIQKRISPAK